MDLPFDGAISAFYQNDAPRDVRAAVDAAKKCDLISSNYPYATRLPRKAYEKAMAQLQIELVKLQSWSRDTGTRIAIVFEGRDAAGKGGTIARFRQNLNPRAARVIALSKPTEKERGEWYFQRYSKHLPTNGEMVFFDRSWYNRGVVEPVFGFCTPQQNSHFFTQVPAFEQMIVDDDIHLFKFWLNVGRAEQLRRMLSRESDPLKQWKLSKIDVKGLHLWDEYTAAIQNTLNQSHSAHAPWTILRSDDKRRARVNAIRKVLLSFDYVGKNLDAIGPIDPDICGGPDIWNG